MEINLAYKNITFKILLQGSYPKELTHKDLDVRIFNITYYTNKETRNTHVLQKENGNIYTATEYFFKEYLTTWDEFMTDGA